MPSDHHTPHPSFNEELSAHLEPNAHPRPDLKVVGRGAPPPVPPIPRDQYPRETFLTPEQQAFVDRCAVEAADYWQETARKGARTRFFVWCMVWVCVCVLVAGGALLFASMASAPVVP